MRELVAYLNFDGNCREAMTFYERCLGGELYLMPFSETKCDYPQAAKDRIMHSKLTRGSCTLMASDTMPGTPFKEGNNFWICIQCESRDELERFFTALREKGKVLMELQDTFWGARFGMLTDRFGINWMFNFETAKAT